MASKKKTQIILLIITMLTLTLLLLLLLPVAGRQPSFGKNFSDAAEIILFLKARERLVRTLDMYLEHRDFPTKNIKLYYGKLREQQEARARFYQRAFEFPLNFEYPPPHLTGDNGPDPQPLFFRVRRTRLGQWRIDNLPDSTKPKKSQRTEASVFWDGTVWIMSRPQDPTSPSINVLINEKVYLRINFLQALGMGALAFPGDRGNRGLDVKGGKPMTLSEFFEEMDNVGITSKGKLWEITATKRHKPGSGFFTRWLIYLDPNLGFAPVRYISDEYWECFDGKRRFPEQTAIAEGKWKNYLEIDPGLWIPKSFELRRKLAICLPKDGQNFQALKHPEALLIDTAAGRFDFFDADKNINLIHRINLNGNVEINLDEEIPPGSIIKNQITQEIFQTEGVSPDVMEKLKSAVVEVVPSEGNRTLRSFFASYTMVIIANLSIVFFLLLAYLIYVRRRSAKVR